MMLPFLISFFVPFSIAIQSSSLEEFTIANNLFACDIYKQISKTTNGNFLVSPFPIETLLALTRYGARGPTAEEIHKTIHLTNDTQQIEQALKSFPKYKNDTLYTLSSVNKIYVKKDLHVKDEFKKVAQNVFDADCEDIDFLVKDKAAKAINEWIGTQTKNKIKNLVNSNDLGNNTKAILINALYFKANWSNRFPTGLTRKRNFYKSEKDIIQVDTMHVHEKYLKHYEWSNLKAQVLEIPFRGKDVSMVIILPNEKEGLALLEKQLDGIVVPPGRLEYKYFNVALPKFRMETSTNVKSVLKNLGVKRLFEINRADLSGIADDGLAVDRVVQKSFIDVSEGGVEASAGTYLSFSQRSGLLESPKEFIVDRPFIFQICVEGLIVFAGRVLDPSES